MHISRTVAVGALLVSVAAADSQAQLQSRAHASGFASPVAIVQDPTDRAVQFVVEQGGRVRVVRDGVVMATPFLDLSGAIATGGERGLLGMAFPPDAATSGRVFVNFTNQAGHTVVARFRRSADPLVVDPASRFDLRWGGAGGPAFIAQPYANHNGGHLAFGPDGFLYIGLGDGGSGNDPEHRAQDPAELLGKMLRIDAGVPDSHASGYQVPVDNPFVGTSNPAVRPEIWSFGLRNPWRYSFDDPARGGTGALLIGDVGQSRWEEIDYEPPNLGGRNYGWRNREGPQDNVTSLPPAYLPLVDPIHQYDRASGQSVTGGYVYRGSGLGQTYQGRYFFADFIQGRVWSIALLPDPATGEIRAADLVEHTDELGGRAALGNVSAFGVDADGELFVVSYSLGAVLRLVGPPQTGIPYTVSPGTLYFAGTNTNGTLSTMTAPQSVTVVFNAPTSSTWTATASEPWVHVTNGAGTGSGSFTVSIVNPNNVLAGVTQASATVAVTSSGASNSPQTVAVSLTLRQAGANAPPFGQVDTPAQNATDVVGSIGVTGWVLDDVGVTGVKIYRNCLPFDNPAACHTLHGASVVFVGDAAFLAGARPDVEAAFPASPQAYRAGWGYLMLTNVLPHVIDGRPYGGQGPVTLYAIATDGEGRTTLLGRSRLNHTPTTISLANATIDRPFGAIDTPGQGETVSGLLANFGWVLTRDTDDVAGAGDILMPTDSSTMNVVIDGVAVGTVTYNQCRGTVGNPVPPGEYCNDDVASIFGNLTPQATFTPRVANPTAYRNLDAGRSAIGSFAIDTTTLANGLHTIAWGVTDSAGRTEGIGSRFFSVLNSGADTDTADVGAEPDVGGGLSRPQSAVRLKPDATNARAVTVSLADVRGRTGFDLAAPLDLVPADGAGVRHVRIPDLGRVELHLGPVDAGYLEANGTVRDLPVGSHLDRATGVFTWAPGVGYLGTYRLVFVRGDEHISVDITIRPLTSAAE